MANPAAAPSPAAPAVLLLVESPALAARCSALLTQHLGAAVAVLASSDDATLALSTGAFSCVLVATSLHDASSAEDLCRLVGAAGNAPVIVLDDAVDEDAACAALALGAHDVVSAEALETLPRIIRRAIARAGTERRRRDAGYAALALHDPLTGLATRLLFAERLDRAIARMARNATLASVLFVDVKNLDDEDVDASTIDAVLQVVAHRLEMTARATDTVARIGEHEFLVLCEDLTSADEAAIVAERLHLCLSRSIEIDGHLVDVDATIGVAIADRSTTAESLLRRADVAVVDAVQLAAATERRAAAERENPGPRMLQEALERAITVEAFSLAFQPVTDLPSGRLVAVEALLRWDDGDRIRQPDEFLPVAEASGLIVPLGGWVLREACATLAGWRARGEVDSDVIVSVNLAARQLCDERLFTHVVDALDAAGLPAENLAVEITETTLIGDPDMAMATLARLKDLGVAVWLDDFGTGYSSLSYLDQYPVDAIKLDRSFLRKLGDRRGRALLIMVSDLAARLGIAAIAEGVETEEQREVVARLGFTAAQGFYLGQPQLTVDLLGASERG